MRSILDIVHGLVLVLETQRFVNCFCVRRHVNIETYLSESIKWM
jgi:hypothetical protein